MCGVDAIAGRGGVEYIWRVQCSIVLVYRREGAVQGAGGGGWSGGEQCGDIGVFKKT